MNPSRLVIDWSDVRRRLDHNQRALEAALSVDRSRIDDTLRRRAVQWSRRKCAASGSGQTLPLLVFSLASEHYGVALEHVVKTLASPCWTPVPGGPSYLLGVADFDGEVRSVLDLRPQIGLPATDSDPVEASYVILIRCAGTLLGLRVDSVDKVCRAAIDRIAPFDDAREGAQTTLIRGVTDDKVIVLDMKALGTWLAARALNPA